MSLINLGAGLTQSYSNSANSYANQAGSVNTAQNISNGWSEGGGQSWSNSWTDAASAREWSAMMADIAWQRDLDVLKMQMDYNSKEALKQRQWTQRVAGTNYQRAVRDMKRAGINPILAYQMGFSGSNVGSGATASLGGVPSAPVAQNFMDSYSSSGSTSFNRSQNNANGWSDGSSWSEGSGSGWSSSEGGIATALSALGEMSESALEMLNSGIKTEEAAKVWNEFTSGDYPGFMDTVSDYIVDGIKKGVKNIGDGIIDWFNGKKEKWDENYGSGKGGHSF